MATPNIVEDNFNSIKFATAINEDYNKRTIHNVSSIGKVVVLMSDPGMGKSATVYDYVKLLDEEYRKRSEQDENFPYKGADLILLDLSILDQADMGGLPSRGTATRINDKGEEETYSVVDYLAMPWMRKAFENESKGIVSIIFCDEAGNIQYDAMSSALGLLQDRIILHERRNPLFYRIVGCMNPEKTSVNPTRFKPAMNNRITKVPFKFDRLTWLENMVTSWGKPITRNEYSWRCAIVEFLKNNVSLTYQLPPEVSAGLGGTNMHVASPSAYNLSQHEFSQIEILETQWPSPRSWDSLAKILSQFEFISDDAQADTEASSEVYALTVGTVGYRAGLDFLRFIQNSRTVNVMDIVRKYDGKPYSKEEPVYDFTKSRFNNPDTVMLVVRELYSLYERSEISLNNLAHIYLDMIHGGRTPAVAPYSDSVLIAMLTNSWPAFLESEEGKMFTDFRATFIEE